MRILLFLSDLMIPLLFFYIIGFGLLMKKDIYNDFVTGAFDGLKTVVKIMPTLIGLMTSVGILRASGFLDALASLLENLLKPTGFPSALVPLSIVKMFSSSAATSLLLDLYKQYGPDSTYRPDRFPHPQQHRNHLLHAQRLLHSRQSPKNQIHPPRRSPGHFLRHHRQHHHSKPYVNLYSFTFSPDLHKSIHMLILPPIIAKNNSRYNAHIFLLYYPCNIHFPIPANPLRSQPLSPPRKKQRQTPGFLVWQHFVGA